MNPDSFPRRDRSFKPRRNGCHSGSSGLARRSSPCSPRNQKSAALAFALWFARVFHATPLFA
jgi:hypothetical protein